MLGAASPPVVNHQRNAPGVVRWAVLLINVITTACLDMQDSTQCTPADTTYSCCMKKHFDHPEFCDGRETTKTVVTAGKVVATSAVALGLRDEDSFQRKRSDIEEVLARCARQTEDDFNRLRLGGRKPTVEDCGKVIGKGSDGSPVTQAIQWGLEKHDLVRACVNEHLAKHIRGSFSLEQRYRYDPATGRKSLVSQEEVDRLLREGRQRELTGTLQPDVVIHNGDPLKPWAVYDFKFPCPEDKSPSWSPYRHGPFKGRDQGDVYSKAFGSPASRVAPDWGILRGS